MRVWFSFPQGLGQYGDMLEIRQTDAESGAKATTMRIFFNPSRLYENINSHRDSTILAPLSGWERYNHLVDSLAIWDLGVMDHLPAYKELDGEAMAYANSTLTVSMELANMTHYKFVQYNSLEDLKEIDEVNRFYQFITYLRADFGMHEIHKNWYGGVESRRLEESEKND